MNDIEKRARELLAAEYDSNGGWFAAECIRNSDPRWDASEALSAIIAALTPSEGFVLVPVGQEPVDFYVCDACGHHYMEYGITCDCTPDAVQPPMRHVRMLAARPEVSP